MNDPEENLRLFRQGCTDVHPEFYVALEGLIAAGLLACRLVSTLDPETCEHRVEVVLFATKNNPGDAQGRPSGPEVNG